MKADVTRLLAALLGLVVCAAAQDISPAMFGAKAPILLAFGCLAGIPTALFAGLLNDVLGAMPFGCSAMFFLAAAVFTRLARTSAVPTVVLCAVAHQVWASIWGGGMGALSLGGMLVAFVSALVLAPAMRAGLHLARRRIGIDREEEAQ